jgi:putative tricarboxylic transport membrane protein
MFEAFWGGLLIVLQLKPFLFMLLGCAIGFAVGILPGLGGTTTLALMLPFIYTMTPFEAFPFLLGMHSVIQTTGDITSVLFGIPGEATTVATIIDGHAMAKNGEAGRALGAALMSSLVGACIGALFLAVSIPVIRPLILTFGSPEMFMLIVIGLTCISSLSGKGMRSVFTGIAMGAFGFVVSLIGQDPQQGVLRFTFGSLYLWNGIPIVPAIIGLFAIPELVELSVQGTSISGNAPLEKMGKGVIQGIKDTFIHFWLVVRCSLIGAGLGILPGIGGGVSQWVSYAHAVQSAKTPEERDMFGKGYVKGVLGPGSANNSKEGAALITTVGFGIPTTASMAVLMGGFYILGLQPGPDMLTKHLAITYSMVWTIIVANIVVVLFSLLIVNKLAALTNVKGHYMVPFILLLCFIGAFSTNENLLDLLCVMVFGGLGFMMVKYGFPRPPLVLGLILGNRAEMYLYTSVKRYGAEWLARPWVITLIILTVIVAFYPYIQDKLMERREARKEQAHAL